MCSLIELIDTSENQGQVYGLSRLVSKIIGIEKLSLVRKLICSKFNANRLHTYIARFAVILLQAKAHGLEIWCLEDRDHPYLH